MNRRNLFKGLAGVAGALILPATLAASALADEDTYLIHDGYDNPPLVVPKKYFVERGDAYVGTFGDMESRLFYRSLHTASHSGTYIFSNGSRYGYRVRW